MSDASDIAQATVAKVVSMADGGTRLWIDIHDPDAPGLRSSVWVGTHLGVAVLNNPENTQENPPDAPETDKIGTWYQNLIKSGFFLQPDLWPHLGTSDDYFDWLKTQKSALSNQFTGYDEQTGDGYCDPAHHRKVDQGAGTAIKPPYWGIPLTREEHQIAHSEGDQEIGDDAWWRRKCKIYLQKWAILQTKEILQVESLKEIAPEAFTKWAQGLGITIH